VQFQAELQESLLQLRQEPFRVKPMLEANNEVVAVTHDDDVAMRPLLPPLLYPQIEDIMEVDVGQQG